MLGNTRSLWVSQTLSANCSFRGELNRYLHVLVRVRMNAMLRTMAFSVFILGLCVCSTSCQSGAVRTEKENFGTIKLEYTAALTGDTMSPCHIVVYQPKGDTFETPLPQRLVVYDYPENQDGKILWQCYRDDTFLKYADLLQYYSVTKIEFADVDSDGIDEAVISWDSDSMGSGWIQTLEVLDYDRENEEFGSYKGVTASGPFGGFLVDSLDPDGSVQRVFAYSFRSDGMDTYGGTECRWCPHRYRVAVYTITEDGLVIDPHWHSGQIAYTQLRFPCDGSGNPTDEYHGLNDYYMRSSLYNALEPGPSFVVLSPQPNQTVGLPFSLRVEIPQDMPELGIKIVSTSPNGDEQLLLEDIIEGWACEPSTSLKLEDFVYYSAPSSSSGRIVLYDPANPHDDTRKLTIPIVFEAIDTTTVQIFFPNERRRSEPFDEQLLYPVERTISKTGSPEEEALIQLFRGPTGVEDKEGFFTYLGPVCKAQDVYYPRHLCSNKLKKLEIKDGVAYVWTYDIEWPDPVPGMGGVHFMAVALDQIKQTLLQFPNISRVVIW